MKYSVKIGSLWSIPIELHVTFLLLMAAVLALTYPDLYFFFLTLFLFVFVTLHELSHSLVAKRYGIKVRKIVLYPIGGVSEIEEIPENPRIEWRMALAGPMTSVVIGAIMLSIYIILTRRIPEIPLISLTGDLVLDMATLNIFLGLFNLIPAFPMDGGRVLRALLAEKMKFADATKYASFVGRFLGIVMAVFGILYDFWLVIIGVFIYIGASEETEQTIVSTTLARVRVRDVMYPQVASVTPETTLARALEVMFVARYHDVLVEKDGIYQGTVTWKDIMKVKPEQRSQLRVEQMPMKYIIVFTEDSILEAYKLMAKEKIDLIPAVEKEAPTKVVGAVTSESVAFAYEKAKSLR